MLACDSDGSTTRAIANRALPIDDRSVERMDARTAGRPDPMASRKSLTVYLE
jgi:hypothetical protein